MDNKGIVTVHNTGKVVIRLKLYNKKTKEYVVVAPVVFTVPEKIGE